MVIASRPTTTSCVRALSCVHALAFLLIPISAAAQESVAVGPLEPTPLEPTPLEPTRRIGESVATSIDEIVTRGLADGEMAGAVVAVADGDGVLFAKAYGHRRSEPDPVPMTLDTLFDLASLTKPLATACSVMTLVERGKIDLDAAAADYLPEFGRSGKGAITVTDLLLHQGGLIPDNALGDYDDGADVAWEKICGLGLRSPPGEKFAYTDVGFIVLGKLVERVSGQPLDEYARDVLYQPLGMPTTGFNPADELRQRAAATERRGGAWMAGEVHDPRAYRLSGVAGHAGLFSTAADLIAMGQMLLGKGARDGVRVMRAETVEQMSKPREVSRGQRTLGWDNRSPYSRNRGDAFSDAAFGHGGFTGTVMWVDPVKDRVFVFLSNRLHPDGKGTVNGLAGEIATIVGKAVPQNADDSP